MLRKRIASARITAIPLLTPNRQPVGATRNNTGRPGEGPHDGLVQTAASDPMVVAAALGGAAAAVARPDQAVAGHRRAPDLLQPRREPRRPASACGPYLRIIERADIPDQAKLPPLCTSGWSSQTSTARRGSAGRSDIVDAAGVAAAADRGGAGPPSVDRGRGNPSDAGAVAHPDRAVIFDCSEIEAATAYAEQVTREKRHALDRLMGATARGHAASLSPDVASIFKTAAACAGTTRPAEVG